MSNKELTDYQKTVVAERDELVEKIATKEAFINTDPWATLGAEEHNHIVYELGAMRALLETQNERIKSFTAEPAEPKQALLESPKAI